MKGLYLPSKGNRVTIGLHTQEAGTDGINGRVKELRQTLGLSQAKFADGIHISYGYQAKLELGRSPVHDRLIALITQAFGVNEGWLRTGEGPMFRRPVPDTPAEKLERMAGVFGELYPEFQDFILNQIDRLLVLQDLRRE
jgi:transcriptional regulator with XRE-family HTH domain